VFIAENPVAPTLRASDCKRGDNQTVVVEDFYPDRVRVSKESPTLRGDRNGLKVANLRQIGTIGKDSEATRVYDPKGIARTIKNGGGMGAKTGLYATPAIRRLTPTECERLQGFPDNWTEGVSDTQRYKCCGNAVTVNVVRFIVNKLFKN
jgi:site-specific DNA-cytosine methylase